VRFIRFSMGVIGNQVRLMPLKELISAARSNIMLHPFPSKTLWIRMLRIVQLLGVFFLFSVLQ
jgi:hypothetical protein